MSKHFTAAAAAMAAFALAGAAQASVSVVVPGVSSIYLAGHPAGTVCCADLSTTTAFLATDQLVQGGTLNFAATGGVDYAGGGTAGRTPDGITNFAFNMPADYGTGIAGAQGVYVGGMIGVFIGAGTPGGPAPAPLNFGLNLGFASLSPGLNQAFWIGDGLTGLATGTGSVQNFVVPLGATRLYLGNVDGGGFYNNTGAFNVTISGSGLRDGSAVAVPEPASWAMMIVGLGGAGALLRRRRAARVQGFAGA